MFVFKKHVDRRAVLKGAGVALVLPFLDAMVPAATALAQTAAKPRMRAGFFYIPHGAVQFDTKFGPEGDRWTPSGAGASYKLNAITAPLELVAFTTSTCAAAIESRNAAISLPVMSGPGRLNR